MAPSPFLPQPKKGHRTDPTPGLGSSPSAFLALSHMAPCPALYAGSIQIHFLEQIHASVSLETLFLLKLHLCFTCQSPLHSLRINLSIISERLHPGIFVLS